MGRLIEMLVYAVIVVLVIGGALYLLAFYANENTRGAAPNKAQPVSQSPASPPPAAPPQAGSGSQ